MRLALLALVAGCGSGIDYEDYAGALRDARCGFYVRCGAAATVADCRAYYAENEPANPSPGAAIDAGKLTYDADAAQACIDAWGLLACDTTLQTRTELDVCSEVFGGAVGDGGACGFDRECVSNRCAVPSCPDACCQGTCMPDVPLPDVGQPCTSFCAGDAYCGVDGVCHAPLPAGAACDSLTLCAPDLYCAGVNRAGVGVCTALPKTGEPCEGPCAHTGDRCVDGACARTGVAGDDCITMAWCSQFYTCNAQSECGTYPTLGMSCDTRCSGDAFCEAGLCVARKPNGQTCTFHAECASSYCANDVCSELPVCI